jgi:hypothetical protein
MLVVTIENHATSKLPFYAHLTSNLKKIPGCQLLMSASKPSWHMFAVVSKGFCC